MQNFFLFYAILTLPALAQDVMQDRKPTFGVSGRFLAAKPFPPAELPALPNLKDESFIVNEKDSSLANVLVFLVSKEKHSDKSKVPVRHKLAFNNGVFSIRVIACEKNDVLEISNQSSATPYVEFSIGSGPTENDRIQILSGKQKELILKKSSVFPRDVLASAPASNVSPAYIDRIGYVSVLDNPWHCVTDNSGIFKIEGLPIGKYTLYIWHEKYNFSQGALVKNKSVEITENGFFKVELVDSNLTLGDFTLHCPAKDN